MSEPKDPPSFTTAQSRAVWMLAIGETLVWAGLFYSFAALFLSWERDLGWEKSEIALGFTLAVFTAAVFSPLTGRIVDAGLGRWLLAIGALLGAVALCLLSVVQTQLGFIGVWMIVGIAQSACLYEPCFALVTRTTGGMARSCITRITLAAGFASPIAFPAGALLASAFGWRSAVVVFAAVIACVAAPLLFFGASRLERKAAIIQTQQSKKDDKTALKQAVRHPAFWLIVVAFSLLALNHSLLINHIVPILTEKGFNQFLAVTVASVVGPMQVLGRLLMFAAGRFAKTMGMTMVCFGGVFTAALFLLFSEGTIVLAFAFAATQGAAYGLVSILKPSVISDIFGRRAFGTISGWLALPYLTGGALGPIVGAVLWGVGGYDLAIFVAAILALIGLICVMFLSRIQKIPTASS